MDSRTRISGTSDRLPRSLPRLHRRIKPLQPHDRQPPEPLSDLESLSDGEILSDAEPLEESTALSAAWMSAFTLSLIHFQPYKQPPEPLSPSETPSYEELHIDSGLSEDWKTQSTSARARVNSHSGDYEATSLLARGTSVEPKMDLVARQAGKIALWRGVRWSNTERLARHVRALELSSTRTEIIYTRKEVEWRQQKLEKRLKRMRNRLASAEAKAKKKAKKNDTDRMGKM